MEEEEEDEDDDEDNEDEEEEDGDEDVEGRRGQWKKRGPGAIRGAERGEGVFVRVRKHDEWERGG